MKPKRNALILLLFIVVIIFFSKYLVKIFKTVNPVNPPSKTESLEEDSPIEVLSEWDNNELPEDTPQKPNNIISSGDKVLSFFDDFENGIDPEFWLISRNQWGGEETKNNGVIPKNVSVENGIVKITVLGDLYEGNKRGLIRDANNELVYSETGKRTGGVIVTRNQFGSGSFEVKARLVNEPGVSNAFWTFFYRDGRNDEIDWETPGDGPDGPATNQIMANTWIDEITPNSLIIDTPAVLSSPDGITDGNWHIFRFDWHTEKDNPRVEFYIDNILVHISMDKIPTFAGRFWLGVFTKDWAGIPDFSEGEMEIDWVRITPFYENGDEYYPLPLGCDCEWATINEYPVNLDTEN